ncbi:MAG: hypothetical protein Q8N51_16740 [Gammaproteobacteria bacterium]|nr:hypothetical protein [Gammaproteobacteria bacterium]
MRTGFLSVLRSLLGMLGLALTGGLVLPIASYVVGKRVIGAYEGKLGLSDYLSSVYSAAAHGEVLAWWLLLTPILIAIVWYAVFRLGRRLLS